MPATLSDLLPDGPAVTSDLLLDRFLDYASSRGLTLYPAQEEAMLALLDGQSVILNTPTGSGKSLVATALLFAALARHERAVCTFPIKALVNEEQPRRHYDSRVAAIMDAVSEAPGGQRRRLRRGGRHGAGAHHVARGVSSHARVHGRRGRGAGGCSQTAVGVE